MSSMGTSKSVNIQTRTILRKLAVICALIMAFMLLPGSRPENLMRQAPDPVLKQTIPNSISFKIDADKKIGSVSPMIYGQMIEHAYWSVHLGLWAQLIDNGGFELDRDKKYPVVAQGWQLTSTNKGNQFIGRLDSVRPFNARFSQQISISKFTGGEVRLSQNDLYVKQGVDYRGFVFIRGDKKVSGRVIFLSNTGEELALQELGKATGDTWRRFDFSLRPNAECKNASFVVGIKGEGVLNVDQIQINPSDTYQGHGTRADMIELYKGLKPAFIRWPGGTYLIWHHWKNGIGPHEMRPVGDGRMVIGQVGEWDPNTFGTDEYMQFCKDVGAEPMVNVNIKDGLQNTLDWIEYCNGEASTQWGNQRVKNGHPDPYSVKYWVIDNEPTHRSLEKGFETNQYPRLAREWAEAMKKKDSSIKILIMGNTGLQANLDSIPRFTSDVIRETAKVIDALCEHLYYDEALRGTPYRMGVAINKRKILIDQLCGKRDVKVALTEWNPQSYASDEKYMMQSNEVEKNSQQVAFIDERAAGEITMGGNMNQAIEGAQIFHIMERASASNILDIATPCQLCVNVDRYSGTWLRSALVQINNHSAWTSPFYHVNALYSRLRQPYMVQTEVKDMPSAKSPDYNGVSFPAVDVVATCSESKNLIVIKAVSNSSSQEYELKFEIQNVKKIRSIKTTEIRSDSPFAMNTASAPSEVVPKEGNINAEGTRFSYTIKPHTVAAMEVKVE